MVRSVLLTFVLTLMARPELQPTTTPLASSDSAPHMPLSHGKQRNSSSLLTGQSSARMHPLP